MNYTIRSKSIESRGGCAFIPWSYILFDIQCFQSDSMTAQLNPDKKLRLPHGSSDFGHFSLSLSFPA